MHQFEVWPRLARIDYAAGEIAYGVLAIAYGVLGIVYGNLLYGSVKWRNLIGNFRACRWDAAVPHVCPFMLFALQQHPGLHGPRV